MTQAALLAALYTALTYLQNFLLPGSASAMIQFRVSEALCVLALFTPAAIPGLSIGCLLFNLTSGAALPLDFLVGSLASLLAAIGMWFSRKITLKKVPVLGLLMPALTNAVLVGWELSVYIGQAFWLNAAQVAIGEAAVLLTLGNVDADILLIDEILAVGDVSFQAKCFEKLKEIKRKGTTIVIVSHSLESVKKLCNRAIWIKDGRIEMDGDPKTVIEKYLEICG